MSASFADRNIGEIAATLPGATAIFRRHKLDFCCGGGIPLAEAAAKRAAPLNEIEADLAALTPSDATLPQSTAALVDLIEQRYHAAHRRELPELINLARRVERVHADNPNAPAGLADLLDTSISVAEVGVFKTDFRVYERVGARYGVAPSAISFQSSNRWDVAGAAKFGFRSVWINRTKAPDEYLDMRPAAVLDGLTGLLSL